MEPKSILTRESYCEITAKRLHEIGDAFTRLAAAQKQTKAEGLELLRLHATAGAVVRGIIEVGILAEHHGQMDAAIRQHVKDSSPSGMPRAVAEGRWFAAAQAHLANLYPEYYPSAVSLADISLDEWMDRQEKPTWEDKMNSDMMKDWPATTCRLLAEILEREIPKAPRESENQSRADWSPAMSLTEMAKRINAKDGREVHHRLDDYGLERVGHKSLFRVPLGNVDQWTRDRLSKPTAE